MRKAKSDHQAYLNVRGEFSNLDIINGSVRRKSFPLLNFAYFI